MSNLTLFDHQQRGVEIARTRPTFAYFWSPGTGKTIAIQSIQKERPMRTLVVATKSIIWSAWVKDAETTGVRCQSVYNKNRAKRLELIREPGDHIIVTNYEQFRAHVDEFIASGVRRVVFDESSKIKNRKAKVTQAAIKMGDACDEVYLLSGTPAPNCATELWSQLRTLSPQASGPTFFKWAYNWFIPIIENIRGRKVIARWVPKPDKVDEFSEYLRSWSWALRKDECLDLPDQLDVVREVELTRGEQSTYDTLIEELRLTCGDDAEVNVASEAVLMKLRQVVGGTVKFEGEAKDIGSTKIDALVDVLDEIGPAEPVVIWAEFRADIDRIVRRLTSQGDTVGTIDGRTSHEAQATIDRFMRGELNRLVCHPKAAGHGTDGLQKVCKYAVYYSLSFSAEEHEQSRDRLHRSGQLHPVTYIYMVAKDSVDESLLWVVRRKATKQHALLKELKMDPSEKRGAPHAQ